MMEHAWIEGFRAFAAGGPAELARLLSREIGWQVGLTDARGRPIGRGRAAQADDLRLPILGARHILGHVIAPRAAAQFLPRCEALAREIGRHGAARLRCRRRRSEVRELHRSLAMIDRLTRPRCPSRSQDELLAAVLRDARGAFGARARIWAASGPRWIEAHGAAPPPAAVRQRLRSSGALAPVPPRRILVDTPDGPQRGAFRRWGERAAQDGWVGFLRPARLGPVRRLELQRLADLSTALAGATAERHRAQRLRTMLFPTVRSLVVALDAVDARARGHAERVQRLATAMARRLGLPDRERRRLSWAALLHDIGRISGDGDPLRACDILAPIPQLHPLLPAVRHQAERFDGRGLPDGLAGEAIPLAARILAVADGYDRLAHPASEIGDPDAAAVSALEEMAREAGARFDPRVIAALAQEVEGAQRRAA